MLNLRWIKVLGETRRQYGRHLYGSVRKWFIQIQQPSLITRWILVPLRRRHDVLSLWTDSANLVQDFLSHINSSDPSIKFTLEVRSPTINFLDLTISILNKRHIFKIFRKCTSTDIIIRTSSFHHPTHKSAVLNFMIHWLLTVSLLPQDFYNEVNTIRYLAYANGFRLNVDGVRNRTPHFLIPQSLILAPLPNHQRGIGLVKSKLNR